MLQVNITYKFEVSLKYKWNKGCCNIVAANAGYIREEVIAYRIKPNDAYA